MADKPRRDDMNRVTEDAEEGPHGRLDDPGTRPEAGPIERGTVDAGPTGYRTGGYRQAVSGRTIAIVGGIVILVMAVVLYWLFRII